MCNLLLLFGIALSLLHQAAPFQQQRHRSSLPTSSSCNHHEAAVTKKSRSSREIMLLFSGNETPIQSSSDEWKQQRHCSSPAIPAILMSAALGFSLCGSPQMAGAAIIDETRHSPTTTATSIIATSSPSILTGMSVSNYLGQVFQSPYQNPGATPLPADSKFDDARARNRAYDQAFERDARDRDAYYGKMAAIKSERALQDVRKNREALGLDGDGDVRQRVGEERVMGMSSLRDYLMGQDPSTLTPEELKVYRQMKDDSSAP